MALGQKLCLAHVFCFDLLHCALHAALVILCFGVSIFLSACCARIVPFVSHRKFWSMFSYLDFVETFCSTDFGWLACVLIKHALGRSPGSLQGFNICCGIVVSHFQFCSASALHLFAYATCVQLFSAVFSLIHNRVFLFCVLIVRVCMPVVVFPIWQC